MPHTEWTDKLSVGVPEMDEEHRQWLGILNELHYALKSNADQKMMQKIIEHMLEYTVMHLTHEEMYMLKLKYPLFEAHKEKHQSLVRKIELLNSRLMDENNFRLTVDTLLLLKNWLTNHIMITDSKYGEYAAKLHDANVE